MATVLKSFNIAVIGHGNVGTQLIEQILNQHERLIQKMHIDLNIFAIADSKRVLTNKDGIGENWNQLVETTPQTKTVVEDIIYFAENNHLEHLIAIDNTASYEIPKYYEVLAKAGFDLVSSNKIANTNSYQFYSNLRSTLNRVGKSYCYETNVGAGLPLIDNLRLLHLSGDKITCIRGLFSGSLSYIFNQLSPTHGNPRPFTEVLKECMEAHYLEPDPRIDLCGLDVARKVLILARELDYVCELDDVVTESLVPKALTQLSFEEFQNHIDELGAYIEDLAKAPEGKVVRFVGEFKKSSLTATLQTIPNDSPLALSKGADSCFEIYTENYGDLPIVIQGAGAGAKVTAQGVFADLLRIVK